MSASYADTQDDRDHEAAQQAARVDPEHPLHHRDRQDREREQVHGPDYDADAIGVDRRDREQLEHVGGNPGEIEQERNADHRGYEAAQHPGAQELQRARTS